MFKQGNVFYTSEVNSNKLTPFEDLEIIDLLKERYPEISAAYIPDKYGVAFILVKENVRDSYQDEWKIAFYKKVMKMPEMSGGTITLDNLEDLQSVGDVYEIYKEIDGSFENVIKITCDLVTKHRCGYEKEVENTEED